MMTAEDQYKMIVDLLEHGSTELFQTCLRVPNDQMLIEPAPGKWNLAQILQHIHISDKGAYFNIIRNTTPCDRDPLELLLAHEKKRNENPQPMVAPEKVNPAAEIKLEEVEQIKLDFIKTRNLIVEHLRKLDVTELCNGFPHPRIGIMTRIEWAKFIDWHARHHLEQIKKIMMFTPGIFPIPLN